MDRPWSILCYLQKALGLQQVHENMLRPIWSCLRLVLLGALHVRTRVRLHIILSSDTYAAILATLTAPVCYMPSSSLTGELEEPSIDMLRMTQAFNVGNQTAQFSILSTSNDIIRTSNKKHGKGSVHCHLVHHGHAQLQNLCLCPRG